MFKIVLAIIFICSIIFLFSQTKPEVLTEGLFNAVYEDDLLEVETLLNKGAKLERIYKNVFPSAKSREFKDFKGTSPLHAAAAWGRKSIIEYALSHKINFNVNSSSGNTPLHTAVWERQIEIVKLISERGTSLDVKNNKGETAFDLAKRLADKGRHKQGDEYRAIADILEKKVNK